MSPNAPTSSESARLDSYRGWIAGIVLIGLVLAVGAGLWFRYHGGL
ncbi:MAG TPA: hypothetical protein VGV64_03600 [Thermoplasmata archaeon]|nr:hypothetical protein [Thermoplasmata archaeon]HEV2428917.1 hypothetical protein [Thermoplasmata archaeon]